MKKKSLLHIMVTAGLVAICSLTAQAATLTVTNPVDGAPGSLRNQVAAASAGDTIDFAVAGNLQVLLLGDILIDKELVFIGNGPLNTVINGSNLDRIFTIEDANQVYIEGISFTNGSATDVGGAISIDSTNVTMDNCEVTNSSAAGAMATQGGGGIYNSAGTLTIQNNSLLDGNDATGASGSGGAILNSGGGVLVVMNSVISNNSSLRAGGGIEGAAAGGKITLTNTNLTNNSTGNNPGNGGGLHVTSNDTVMVMGGMVSGNTAGSEGGGLWNNGGYMSVFGTTIRNNTASGNDPTNGGGGIFNNGGDMYVTAIIQGNMADGTSGSGGGIFSVDGDVDVTLTNLDSNRANRAGGAVEIIDGTFDFDGRSTMLYNDVNGTAGTPNPGNGGGLHVSGAGNVTITDIQIAYNEAAREGGGLWNQAGATMTLNNCFIDSNTTNGPAVDDGGGGVFNNGGILSINSGTVISNNTATNGLANGGGVMTLGGTVTIIDATINSNEAARAGGGLENGNGTVIITNTTFGGSTAADGNTAGINGGGIHVSGPGTTNVNGGTFSNNIAQQEGGGLWNGSGTMTINGTTIDGNIANAGNNAGNDQGGGGVFNAGGTLDIDNADIANNEALMNLGNGGGVMTDGGTVTIDSTTISSNQSARAGGGIENFGGMVTITNCTVGGASATDGNTAGINGGGMHVSGTGTTDVDGGLFQNNVAQREGGGLWNNTGTMTVSGTTIDANSANGTAADDGGGGIFNNGGTLNVMGNATISSNTANNGSGSGGGIQNHAGGTLEVTVSTISGNSSARAGGGIEGSASSGKITLNDVNLDNNTTGNSPGNGGGLHVTSADTVVISGGTVNGNTAGQEGGGLWNNGGLMTVNGTLIDGNDANGKQSHDGGGGIFNNGGILVVDSATISNNTATDSLGSGGGIFNNTGGVVTLTSTLIDNNTASRAGGGIEDQSGNGGVNLIGATLSNNMAGPMPGNGGGLHITGSGGAFIDLSIVNGNSASREGGGLWNGAGQMFVQNTTIDGNTASGPDSTDGGGGIWNNGGSIEVFLSAVSNNLADGTNGSGGAAYNANGFFRTTLSTYSGNNANGNGGGIFNFGLLEIGGLTVTNNTAAQQGGGVVQSGDSSSTSTVFTNIIAQNSATGLGQDIRVKTGSITSAGFNVIGEDDANDFPAVATDIVGAGGSPVDAMLLPLADNGGPTQTHALQCGSPAINIGFPDTITGDQRGLPILGLRDAGAFELQTACPGGAGDSLVLVSDTGWRKSTVVTPSNFSGFWPGVNGMLPATATFTDPAIAGQPYGYPSIQAIEGTTVIKTGNSITYFRQEFNVVSPSDANVRIRVSVDDQAEVYLNGHKTALISDFGRQNYKAPFHDVKFKSDGTVDNGFNGGDAFNFVTNADMDTLLNAGTNELILVVRNLGKSSDRGGYSYRMDISSDGVMIPDAKRAFAGNQTFDGEKLVAEIYPNPADGMVNVFYDADDYTVLVYDINGRLMAQQDVLGAYTTINVEGYAQGVYFVKIKSGERVITQKLIKQ